MKLEEFENQLREVVNDLQLTKDSDNNPSGYIFTYKGVELSLSFRIRKMIGYLSVDDEIKIKGDGRFFLGNGILFTDEQIRKHLPEILDLMAILYKVNYK